MGGQPPCEGLAFFAFFAGIYEGLRVWQLVDGQNDAKFECHSVERTPLNNHKIEIVSYMAKICNSRINNYHQLS